MANNVLGTKITDLEEAQAEGLTDDALLTVEPETPPTKRSKLSTFFAWVKGKLAAWILSSYDEVMAATEAGYLVDALAVKDGFTQLNTNIANKTSLRGFSSGQKIDFDFRPFGRNIARMRVADSTMFDLVPNNADSSTNNKITNLKVDYSSTPWKLSVDVYIDGRTYTKIINFDA